MKREAINYKKEKCNGTHYQWWKISLKDGQEKNTSGIAKKIPRNLSLANLIFVIM